MPEEGKPEMPTPEQGPKIGFTPWILEDPKQIEEIKEPQLKRIITALERTPLSLRDEQRLRDKYFKIEGLYEDKKIPEDEAWVFLDKITRKLEELASRRKEAEPEIEWLKRPETTEEAISTFLDEIFNLHERGLQENKGWEKTGELFSEYTTIQRWVKDLPKEMKGKRHEDLSKALGREYPKGVFLKEKMELFLEAMKRLHNREIEVKRAEGGLEDLGVGKVGEAAAPILKVPFTNIRPVDWYVLTHVDELFPESTNPETKINLEKTWSKWQEIGRQPYGFFEYIVSKEAKDEVEEKEREINKKRIAQEEKTKLLSKLFEDLFNKKRATLVLREDIGEREVEELTKRGRGKWDLLRWDFERFKKIKEPLDKDQWKEILALEHLFSSERVMVEVRKNVAEVVGETIGNSIAGIRAESLAHSILTVVLTLDMWDRERWKQKGKLDARDLMWFDWKRINRFWALRPAGPLDTVGSYFADEMLMDKGFEKEIEQELSPTELIRRKEYLELNRQDAVFVVKPNSPSRGTIVGDFFNSVVYEDKDERGDKIFRRLSDVPLKNIPWLEQRKFEEETYEGYFTYNLMFAAVIESNIGKLEWKPDDLKSREFWVKLTDATLRLGHFCPWLITMEPSEQNRIIFKFRRILARGILWTGSYLAQPDPEKPFTTGTFSAEDVYGERILGLIKGEPGILDAIESSGYLDRKNIEILRKEIYDFNFHLKGKSR